MSESTYQNMTREHLGDDATEADLDLFRRACAARQLQTGESDDQVTDWMWGQGDWYERALRYATE